MKTILAAFGSIDFTASALPVGWAALRGKAAGIPRSTIALVVGGAGALLIYCAMVPAIEWTLTASYAVTFSCWLLAALPFARRGDRRGGDEQ